jgi:predicted metalloprotease with PDZ domain
MHVRVLDVFPGSPAHNAGIRPFEDYLLGTDEFGVFCTDHDLEVALREHEIRLYVFHEPSKQLRVVKVRPDPNWGGKGSLGCDIGTGPAHQIPSQNGKMIVFKKE